MRETVKGILIHILEVPLTGIEGLEMKDADLWDSLKHMELILAVEETFDVNLTFDEIVQMQSYKDIVRVLEAKGCN